MSMQHKIVLKSKFTSGMFGPRLITPTDEDLMKYKKWCMEVVGPNGWNYYGQYRKVPFEFRFKRGEDLLAFKLTFGLHD